MTNPLSDIVQQVKTMWREGQHIGDKAGKNARKKVGLDKNNDQQK